MTSSTLRLTRTPALDAPQHFLLEGIAEQPFDGRQFGILTDACNNPMCSCKEVYLFVFPDAQMEADNCAFTAHADIGTHTAKGGNDEPDSQEAAKLLGQYLSPDDWVALGNTWRGIKAAQIEDLTPKTAAALEFDFAADLSVMEEFAAVFPHCLRLNIVRDGTALTTFDQYCVNPKCACTDVMLDFFKENQPKQPVFSILYDYRTGQVNGSQTIGIRAAEATAFITAIKNTTWPELDDWLARRNKILRAMRQNYPRHPVANTRRKLMATSARNAVCSCGSGKKYKHCCGK